MPPKESQKQKQKQTVIVNIGDKLLVKKRKRKPRKKAGAAARPPPPPPPYSPQDFARVIYPVNNLRPDDNTTVQLNELSAQLKALQAAGAGNLPAQAAAAATVNPIFLPTPITQPTQAPKPRGRAGFNPLSPVIPPPVQDESPVVNPLAAQVDTSIGNPLAAAEELGGGGGGERSSSTRTRKVRSDKDRPRGPSVARAARDAIANDSTLQVVKNRPANPLQAAEQPAASELRPIKEKKLKVVNP